MAFDEKLAFRIRRALGREETLEEIKMFGGVCFKVNGKMACGVLGDKLIVKVDPERYEPLMKDPHTEEFDFTGKPMRGILMVREAGIKTSPALRRWLAEGLAVAKAAQVNKKKKPVKRGGRSTLKR